MNTTITPASSTYGIDLPKDFIPPTMLIMSRQVPAC
jgi:hypothetical protein